ncbi:hypothetical protein BABINDRAFT_26199, partial [Babjeviella inositovora NRRL Y-12698]
MPQNHIPENEQGIYTQLSAIRTYLSQLKKDRSKFIEKNDIYAKYEEVLRILNELTALRGTTTQSVNRVDAIFDDVCQLLSLCFVTAGLVNTAPATYASLCTVHRLLEHLNESGIYTVHDLAPIKTRLDDIRQIVMGSQRDSEHLHEENALLHKKLRLCEAEFAAVERQTHKIPAGLKQTFGSLVELRQCLYSLASTEKPDKDRLAPLVQRLSEIEATRDDSGKFVSEDGGEASEAVMNGLLDDCHNLIDDMAIHNNTIDPQLQTDCARLVAIKTSLENLLVTRRWTLRETDLYYYQKQLQEIEEERAKKSKTIQGHAIILYLLRRCYAIIYILLESSEPVSEALQPLHNQLSTVRRCLLEVKRMGGISSTRELYPYQMKLASLDNLRVDGKFMVKGQIPEGQGTLIALLSECYEVCDEMKVELEE